MKNNRLIHPPTKGPLPSPPPDWGWFGLLLTAIWVTIEPSAAVGVGLLITLYNVGKWKDVSVHLSCSWASVKVTTSTTSNQDRNV